MAGFSIPKNAGVKQAVKIPKRFAVRQHTAQPSRMGKGQKEEDNDDEVLFIENVMN